VSRLLPEVYDARFDDREVAAKHAIWREIVRYLQRYVDRGAPVLDVGCDRGYFIRWAQGSERWATDIREMQAALPADVRFVQSSGLDLAAVIPNGTFGTVFMSNYLEHLDSSDAVIQQLQVARQLLRPGGRVIVLQPNIRLIGGRYWDFIDHKVALTERSVVEAAELAELRTVKLITRFLPYSTKGRLPSHPWLVRAYLATRPAWWLMGRQTLFVGEAGG
jgi:2-polyprenyl-3-methyl-5-hydroxy-6-metoxy-1,4-benzoquinol methylase